MNCSTKVLGEHTERNLDGMRYDACCISAFQIKTLHPLMKCYPFTAIVAQDEMKLALILNVIDPSIGGVLIMGHRGTGKSTAVRALAGLLPEITVVQGCPYHCNPPDVEAGKKKERARNRATNRAQSLCPDCDRRLASGEKLKPERTAIRVVDLPLGATEDRICGTIDIERALQTGVKAFEPGLLARANRGFLYIDEVNLLEDHLVDLLLDVAVTGINRVEREGISIEHPARFLLIGSGNPEEGELRPQLLDRFGLHVEVTTENDPDKRVEIVERRDAFERDPETFNQTFAIDQDQVRKKITRARRNLEHLTVKRPLLRQIARLCSELNVDGHRGELTIMRAARALAAFRGRKEVKPEDVKAVTVMAVGHRLRRDALEETSGAARIEETLEQVFSESSKQPKGGADNNDSGQGSKLRVVGQRSPEGEIGSHSKFQASLPRTFESNESQLEIPKQAGVTDLSSRRGQSSGKRQMVFDSKRGRYSRAMRIPEASSRVAVDATLRAAAWLGLKNDPRRVNKEALRYKRFARKSGTLFIFAIDASGSMAINRINQARVAILNLLRESYVNRDRVAIISFRGLGAEVVLPPSRSILRARQALDSIAVGGGTPLSAGLASVISLVKRERVKDGKFIMLLFTDGGANVSVKEGASNRRELIDGEVRFLGAALTKAGVNTVVVDTQNHFRSTGAAREIAERLAARYITLRPAAEIV
ncbi:MAG TPA: magnesium chelatase ATPase subunit I [Pyrinomonadaceae bacterium]|nr:magnesium chelatase ATPase subunit I [Pyrinomonadaceae bacterium]